MSVLFVCRQRSKKMVKRIVDAGYDTLNLMAAASIPELATIPDMGTSKAEAFHKGFHERIVLIKKLLKMKLKFYKKLKNIVIIVNI